MYNLAMKKLFVLIICIFLSNLTAYSLDYHKINFVKNDKRAIKSLLNSQVRYANRENFEKFISTYDTNYQNADGFNLSEYSELVKEIWQTYGKIHYAIKIKDIAIDNDTATVKLVETSEAPISASKELDGYMHSESQSIYKLKKTNNKWKVTGDTVLNETTSMLYGDARKLNISLTAPNEVAENTEYTASLEFIPPEGTLAIASIAKDKVEYPQKQPKEVFRKMPDDNILERLFIANSDKVNEYIVASIGLTKADLKELSLKISLTGFGYYIIRVNVVPEQLSNGDNNAEI